MQTFEITVKAELGCEACAVAWLNRPLAVDGYAHCANHAAQSIDPVIASVIAYEKRRDVYQQLAYELETLGEKPRSGFSRAWAAEYASRDCNAAFARVINELDAAGVIDMEATKSSPEEAARVLMNIIDRFIVPMTDQKLAAVAA